MKQENKVKNLFIGFLMVCGSYSGLANASFIGSEVVLTSYYPNLSSPDLVTGPVLVGTGVEFPDLYGSVWSSDITATTVELTELVIGNILEDVPFNGWEYIFTGAPTIIGATINTSSTLPVTSLSFTGTSITLNYADMVIDGPLTTIVDVTFATVPIPAATWLFGSGLIGLIGVARRKNI